MNDNNIWTKEEVISASLNYFGGDSLATDAFVNKYALKNKQEQYYELTPDYMHARLAREFARIESKYPNPLSEQEIFEYLKNFKYIVPQGGPMAGIGNDYSIISLSNCLVLDSPKDTLSSILETARDMANFTKRRCVSENTWVATNSGLKLMKDVLIGDKVLSRNLDGNISYQTVLNKFETDVDRDESIVISAQSGAEIRTSKKHPILVWSKDVGFEYLSAGTVSKENHYLVRQSIEMEDLILSPLTMKESDKAWFVGHHIGDGTCDRHKNATRFRILGDNENCIKEYARILNYITNSKCNYKKFISNKYKSDVWSFELRNKSANIVAKNLLDNQINSKTYSAKIPTWIRKTNQYLPFLAGLFDADGTIKGNATIVLQICAKDVIDELSVWLASAGIDISVFCYMPKRANENKSYRLSIKPNNNFINMILPYIKHSDKKDKLEKAIMVYHSNKYPISSYEYNIIMDNYNNWEKEYSNNGKLLITNISNLRRNRDGVGKSFLNQLLEYRFITKQIFDSIFSRLSINEISNTHYDKYYDIEVENTQNFFAGNNGLVNIHNCGIGTDLSDLRPENTPVNNSAGTSTGAWSFADLYSSIVKKIGQGGRRAALMITMDIKHPDIEKFVTMKMDKTKVTGANVSVKLRDDFLEAVVRGEEYTLQFPVDSPNPTITKVIKAKDLWNTIVTCAAKSADPGLMFWDRILENLPSHEYPEFFTICTNACSELPMSAYSSCRLISINLSNFILNAFKNNPNFDFEKYKDVIYIAMRLADDLVDLEIEKLNIIIDNVDTEDEKDIWTRVKTDCERGRRVGLGTHGLADALAKLKLRYDSEEAIAMIDSIYCKLKNGAYDASTTLAKERGSFPAFDFAIEGNNKFINSLDQKVIENIKKYGRRNVSLLTNAPTGTVSILSKSSHGLEPVFRNSYIRRRKLSSDEEIKPDFIDNDGNEWVEYMVFHENVRQYLEQKNVDIDINNVPDYFTESQDVDPLIKNTILSVIQGHLDHNASNTTNLPRGTTPEQVGDIYLDAWKKGCKGVTVYVEGTKEGVLISHKEYKNENKNIDRPKRLISEIHRLTIKGEKWIVLVGMLNGVPYEVFAGKADKIELPRKYDFGYIVKHERKTTRNRYDLFLGEGDDEFIIRDIVDIFDNPNDAVLTRMISLSLRIGTPVKEVVKQLSKDNDNNFTSFCKVVSRTLRKYIKNGESADIKEACPNCNQSDGFIYIDGCVQCSCGWSKCS